MAAVDELKAVLTQYGLESLAGTLDTILRQDPKIGSDALLFRLRDTPEYKERFKGNEARRAAGLPELSPGTYLATENALRSTLRASGMPRGFYDTTDKLQRFIGQDVSPQELSNRLQSGYTAVAQADPQVKQELQRLYGWTDADLAAYYLDPTQATTALSQKTTAAQVAFEARRAAGVELTTAEAERLAQAGVGAGEARQAFGLAAEQEGIGQPLMAGETAISRSEIAQAALGVNTGAAQRIATRRRRRQAEFEAGGGFATSQQGVAGLRTVGQ
jgi:hypothetical protein